jgi:hypothetical protein
VEVGLAVKNNKIKNAILINIWWYFKIKYISEWVFFSIWIKSDHVFMLMFYFLEFKKLMVSDRRLDTNKIIFYGILGVSDDKNQ